jgi:hypothetical protein
LTDNAKIAKALKIFKDAMNDHDQKNDHKGWGIGVSNYDLQRLGFDEGEELWPGVIIQTDGKNTGSFRILCQCFDQGDDDLVEEMELMAPAVLILVGRDQ